MQASHAILHNAMLKFTVMLADIGCLYFKYNYILSMICSTACNKLEQLKLNNIYITVVKS